jgi:serine/threonine protein kinase
VLTPTLSSAKEATLSAPRRSEHVRIPAPDNSRDPNGLRVMVLPDGHRLHGYQLSFVAVGGMAVAYRGKTPQGGSVLIKEAPLHNVRAVAALHQERAMLEKLDHPGIVKFQGYFEAGGHAYLVRDYVEGTGLDQQVSPFGDIFLTEELVRDWGLQLCDILGYLHRQTPPVIYRDLKPKNVLRDGQNRLFLIDFGIARSYKEGQAQDTELLGSALTASPEHYGGQTDARSDLYTLAATLHFLLTNGQGERSSPFDFPPVRSVNSQVSEGMELLLQRCLQKDPARRFQTADEFAAALQGNDETTVALPVSERPSPPSPQPTRAWSLPPALLLVIGVGAGALLSSLARREPAPPAPAPTVVEVTPGPVALQVATPPSTPVVRPPAEPTRPAAVVTREPARPVVVPTREPAQAVEPAPEQLPPPVVRPTLEPASPAVPLAAPTRDPQRAVDATSLLQGLGPPASGLGLAQGERNWEKRSAVVQGFPVPSGWWAHQLGDGEWLLASQRVVRTSTQLIRVRSLPASFASSETLAETRAGLLPRRAVLERRNVGPWQALVLEGARGRLRIEEVFMPLPEGVLVVSGLAVPQEWERFQGEFERLVGGWEP